MKKRGFITFVFDDGYEHILRRIVPFLTAKHIPGVFAIPTGMQEAAMDGFTLASPNAWRDITASGHELAAHSVTHPNLTTLTIDTLKKELAEPATILSASTLVYPGGAYNDQVVEEAKAYYQAARTVKKGFESMPPKDPMRLVTYNFTQQNFSPLKANLLALYAYITGVWLIETYHGITDQPHSSHHAISESAFLRHIAFVEKLPLHKVTIKEALSSSL